MLETQFVRTKFSKDTMTDKNSLMRALATRPETSDMILHAFNQAGDNESLLQQLTQGRGYIGSKESFKTIGNEEIQWALMGRDLTTGQIAGTVTGNGAQGSEFTVPMTDNYFSRNDIVRFEDDTQAFVLRDPYMKGNVWCYDMKIVGNEPGEFVSPSALSVGNQVAYNYNAFAEFSREGNMVTASHMMLRNHMTIHRHSGAMSGSAATQMLNFKVKAGNKESKLWLPKKIQDLIKQSFRTREVAMWSSRYNRLEDGSVMLRDDEGKPVLIGSGIEEQISSSNRINVSRLSRDIFWDLATELNDQNNGTKEFFLITGSGGMREFDRAFRREEGFLNATTGDFHISRLSGNQLKFGSQYKSYEGPDGTKFTVVNHPLFNKHELFPGRAGNHGYTAQSYKMFLLDFGMQEGTPNIEMIAKGAGGDNRTLKMWTERGSTGITQNTSKNVGHGFAAELASSDRDGFKVHTLSECMCIIRNPLSCGMIEINPS